MTLPRHIQDYLDQAGMLDVTTGLSHHARFGRCPNCQSMILAGLDDDLALPVHVDALPTTAAGELAALLSGLRTYTLITGELCHRDHQRIAYRSADHEPVHAEHSCSAPWLPVNDRFAPQPTTSTIYDDPPF